MVYPTLVRSNILEYGISNLGKVELYRNMVYSTLVRLNIPEYGIFDLGKAIFGYTISI